jgi:hypothetical protein
MVRDSGMDEIISREDWILLMIRFFIRYFVALVVADADEAAERKSEAVMSDRIR